ncbi:MAG: winged helix-turn-helix domain-containing protein [Vicinamibacterales bacterium]
MRLVFGAFVLDLAQRRLFSGEAEVHLQPKAFDLLRALVDARPRALSKDEILAAVWPGVYVSENTLATVVRDLRTALGDDAARPQYIRTAYGYGYAFVGVAAPDGESADRRPFSGWRLLHDHREIRLREGDNILGRTGHDVVVFDSPTVSRHHAAIRVAGERATVEDLGSKNGTWIGATPVTGPTGLTGGAALRLGSVVVTVQFATEVPTTKTARGLSRRR